MTGETWRRRWIALWLGLLLLVASGCTSSTRGNVRTPGAVLPIVHICQVAECPGSTATASLPAGADIDNAVVTVRGLPTGLTPDVTFNEASLRAGSTKLSQLGGQAKEPARLITARPVASGDDTWFARISFSGPPGSIAANVDYSYEFADEVHVALDSAVQSVHPGSAGAMRLTVLDPEHALVVGSELVSPQTAVTPEGLFVSVKSVSEQGTEDDVEATPLPLVALGPQGSLSVATGPSASYKASKSFDGTPGCSGHVRSNATGSMSVTISPIFDVSWGGVFHPTRLAVRVGASGSEASSMTGTVVGAAKCSFSQSLPSPPITFPTFVVTIGPVPVTITPELDFDFSASISASGKLSEKADQSISGDAGLDWTGSRLTTFGSVTSSHHSVTETARFKGSIRVTVGPKLSLVLFGVVGPYVSADGLLALNVKLSSPPAWTLDGGFEAGVGIAINFGPFHLDKSDSSVISKTWPVATG
ncbi:MAG: hypothetical protein ACLPQS_12050 [Acidimicrobiales bacterium]